MSEAKNKGKQTKNTRNRNKKQIQDIDESSSFRDSDISSQN